MPAIKSIECLCCKKTVERKVRSSKDAGLFCSRGCAFEHRSSISKSKLNQVLALDIVKAEVLALKRIKVAWSKVRTCKSCNKVIYLKYRCYCPSCAEESKKDSRKRTKDTESYKAWNRSSKSKRRALVRSTKTEDFDPFFIFERDGWLCRICGVSTPKDARGLGLANSPELDHVVPLSKGGTHTIENTQCLCRSCNNIKSDKIL